MWGQFCYLINSSIDLDLLLRGDIKARYSTLHHWLVRYASLHIPKQQAQYKHSKSLNWHLNGLEVWWYLLQAPASYAGDRGPIPMSANPKKARQGYMLMQHSSVDSAGWQMTKKLRLLDKWKSLRKDHKSSSLQVASSV